jgi:2-polyprenyl-6-methoxyphenol hydroxylase-like FAD-dependent oxidoreductase
MSRRPAARQRLYGDSRHRRPRHRARRGVRGLGSGEIVGGAALPASRSYWFYEASSALVDGQDPLTAVGAEQWPAPMPAQLAATAPESVLVNRVLRLGALPTWTRGTVALLGDAAHAMEPNLGQGAAQTIEDAEALLVALGACGELSGALADYAAARRHGGEGRTCSSGSPRASPASRFQPTPVRAT